MEVWVNGKKTQIPVSFDKDGIMRNTQNGRPIVSDYDGWAVLDGEGTRRLGYDEAGKRLTGAAKQADRQTKIPLIRKLVDDARTQLQHAPASSEWGPIPALLAGEKPAASFSCKVVTIAENIVGNVAKEGVVEYRPGAKHPFLTKAAGTKGPKPTLDMSGGKPPPAAPRKPSVPNLPNVPNLPPPKQQKQGDASGTASGAAAGAGAGAKPPKAPAPKAAPKPAPRKAK
jgi:hypothetical protein